MSINDMTSKVKNGTIITLSDEVSVVTYTFQNYKRYDLDDNTYIIGYNNPNTDSETLKSDNTILLKNRDILHSLLNLWEKIVLKNNGDFNFTIKHILKWCKKYGFPYLWSGRWTNARFDRELESYPSNRQVTGYDCFDVNSFIDDLHSLYTNFAYVYHLKGNMPYKHITEIVQNKSDDALRNAIVYGIQIRGTIRIMHENNRPRLTTHFESPFELAQYQLMLLHIAPNTTGVKRCECCSSLFITDTAKKKYCLCCNPKKNYAQKKRQEKKLSKVGDTQ